MANFYQRFASSAVRWPERVALELQLQARDAVGERFTYAELRQRAEAVATWLRARRVEPGARCGLLANNSPRWVAAYLGVLAAGGVAVPLDTAFKAEQVARLLDDSGASLLFVDARHLPLARRAIEQRAVQLVLLDSELPADSPEQRLGALRHESAASALPLPRFDEIVATPAQDFAPADAADDDVAVLLYTSGTTSDPKGVVLTHRNLVAEADAVFQLIRVGPSDSLLGVLPLFHALAQMANLLLPLVVGARVVYLEALNTTELMRALAERDITLFACVPQFFYLIHDRVLREVQARGAAATIGFRLLLRVCHLGRAFRLGVFQLNLGKRIFSRVHRMLGPRMRYMVTGGSRFDPAIARDLYALGFDILQAYGLTETSGGATCTPPRSNVLGSVGQPLPGVEVKIMEAAQAQTPDDLPAGTRVGELAIRGPIVMRGYWQRPDATAEVLREGWLYTGDLGYRDARGNVFITGRQKDIIVLSSGKNIYPEELEAHYQKSPYIKEICVLGLQSAPGEPFAERLHAVIVPDLEALRARKIVNAGEVIRFDLETLSAELPSTKRVLSYDLWQNELPRTTTRKLKRFAIQKEVAARRAGRKTAEEAAGRAFSDEALDWLEEPDVARALDVVRSASKLKRADIHPDDSLELDLGLDSMERVELLVALEEALGAHVPDSAVAEIYNVRELVDAVRAATGKQRSESAGWDTVLQESPPDEIVREFAHRRTLAAVFWFMLGRIAQAFALDAFHLRVRGLEKLPRSGPFILCPNHQSFLDAPVLVSTLPWFVLRRLFTVGTSEIFGAGLFRALARSLRVFPVDPDANLVPALRVCAYGLRNDHVLMLYPEGERSMDGTPRRFKKGAAILAAHVGVPIVPVAIDGFFDAWPRGKSFQGFAPLRIEFGDPIPPPAMTGEPEKIYAQHIARVRERVVEMWTRLHGRREAAPPRDAKHASASERALDG